MKWLPRRLVFIALGITILVVIGLVAMKTPQQMQAVSSCIGVLVAIVLVYLTFQYVRDTHEYVKNSQEQLALLREQVERERKVQFAFTLQCNTGRAFFWAANLGRTPIMVERYRVSNGEQEVKRDVKEFLPEGGEAQADITDALMEAQKYWGDVEIAFDYLFAGGSATSDWRGFHLFNDGSHVLRVIPGMHEPETILCPKCQQAVLMTPEGLSRIREKSERVARSREQLAQTCPQHNFDWPYNNKKA